MRTVEFCHLINDIGYNIKIVIIALDFSGKIVGFSNDQKKYLSFIYFTAGDHLWYLSYSRSSVCQVLTYAC